MRQEGRNGRKGRRGKEAGLEVGNEKRRKEGDRDDSGMEGCRERLGEKTGGKEERVRPASMNH